MEVVNNKGRNYLFHLIIGKEPKHWHLFDKGTIFFVIKLV